MTEEPEKNTVGKPEMRRSYIWFLVFMIGCVVCRADIMQDFALWFGLILFVPAHFLMLALLKLKRLSVYAKVYSFMAFWGLTIGCWIRLLLL